MGSGYEGEVGSVVDGVWNWGSGRVGGKGGGSGSHEEGSEEEEDESELHGCVEDVLVKVW